MRDQLAPEPDDLASIEHLLQAGGRQPQVGDQRLDAERLGHFFPSLAEGVSAPAAAVRP